MNPVITELLMESLQREGHAFLKVGGHSMWPVIRNGDQVKIESGKPVGPGDIVAARFGNQVIVHRVISEENGRLILRGDFYPDSRHEFTGDQILGRIAMIRRKGRDIRLHFIQQILYRALSFPLARVGQAWRWMKR